MCDDPLNVKGDTRRLAEMRRTSMGKRARSVEAAQGLSNHIKLNLGVDIDPCHIRNYVIAHWDRVSVLAHKIHETEIDK